MSDSVLTVARRFCGPPASGNGGYVAGRLAAHVDAPAVTVTLRQPPPLDIPLDIRTEDGAALLTFGGAVVAEAVPTVLELDPVEPVSADAAAAAERAYAGLRDHPFPTCFVCGVDRSDGLGLRPGQVDGSAGITATIWRPGSSLAGSEQAEVAPEYVWAALDCPGGWTNDLLGRPMVLGRITAAVDALPLVDDACLVVGRLLDTQGRKSFTATTVYDPDGRVLARAAATWFVVDPAAFS